MLDSAILAATLMQSPSRSASCAAALVRLDIAERMDAFVGADRGRRQVRQPGKPAQVIVSERLLDEHQTGVAGAFDIATGVREAVATIGVGAERRGGAQ